MRRRTVAHFGLFAAIVMLNPGWAGAQQKCQPPAPSESSRETNIFSEQQEVDLGDAIAEHIQRDFRVIDDEEAAGYLRKIGERLVKHLPPTNLRFQFFLVDLPEANAFVLPGGRIFVSRKLIAFTQSEDELAGVLSHEIGHLIARQQTKEISRQLKAVLGVTQAGDRKDIFEKYNQLVENAARKPEAFKPSGSHEDKDQIEADQIGLFALASAGYDPNAHARLFDRVAETKGKTGNFFSDLFGATRPEARRLREMIKSVSSLPEECIETRAKTGADEYKRWQSLVVAYNGLGRKESLHNVVSRITLEPPLRGDINHLKFSADGRYVIAQDDTGINVLSRDPFKSIFRIDAAEAHDAQFTPDSQNVVFHTEDLRVESWAVAEEKMNSAQEIVIRKDCLQTGLAPDGKTLACLDGNFDLFLYEVTTGAQIFQKKNFYNPDPLYVLLQSLVTAISSGDRTDDLPDVVNMGFSSDARYFVAGQRGISINALGANMENAAIVIDLQTRAPLSLKGNIKKMIAGGFAFMGPDRLLAFNAENPSKSGIITLPNGEIMDEFAMFSGKMAGVTKGNYVLVRPFDKYAVGIVDVARRMGIRGHKMSAVDIYDHLLVVEQNSGELALIDFNKNKLVSSVSLPRNPLGRLRTVAVSRDFAWLAVSERSRGGVWDLKSGARALHMRGFRGSYFADDGRLYADFPKHDHGPRQLAWLNPKEKTGAPLAEINEPRATQYGQFILLTRPAKEGAASDDSIVLEMRDSINYKLLWSKPFEKESPRVWVDSLSGSMVFAWAVDSKTARNEIKNFPALRKQAEAMKEKEGDYFLQVLDARTGEIKGRLLIETGMGSFRIYRVYAVGDWLIINDSENRVLVYSTSTGEQKGRVFGSKAIVSKVDGLICVENERGRLSIYDLATMQKRDQFTFTHPVALASFSEDGKRLLVLTTNQIVYLLSVSK